MEALIITILVLVVAGLILTAPALSDALVIRCAQRLPPALSARMQEEWIAELGFISTRPGKLAFAIALILTRRGTFATAAGEELMPEFHDRSNRLAAIFGSWPMLLILPTIICSVLASFAASYLPDVYESKATILVLPPLVPEEFVRSTVSLRLEDRLGAMQQQIMSRTRLERIVLDFDLYKEQRHSGAIMEDVVEQMRRDITAAGVRADAFEIGFKSEDPRVAMRITERLASMFIDESLRDRSVLAEGTTQFLDSELEGLARSLIEMEQKREREDAAGEPGKGLRALQYETLAATYQSLFRKKLEAQMSQNLERRQIGETFKILDAARLPSRPSSPNRGAINLIGALTGAAIGGMAIAGFFRRSSRALAG